MLSQATWDIALSVRWRRCEHVGASNIRRIRRKMHGNPVNQHKSIRSRSKRVITPGIPSARTPSLSSSLV
ncbi:hypothetical protein C8Q76DRAFT_709399 [Earliella scabrosa]|nr:hypothetical protein C8Q76DRAFT_709399 [Earliella scabrosa]